MADLLLEISVNIISDIIWVLFTVFLIGRLLDKREKKKEAKLKEPIYEILFYYLLLIEDDIHDVLNIIYFSNEDLFNESEKNLFAEVLHMNVNNNFPTSDKIILKNKLILNNNIKQIKSDLIECKQNISKIKNLIDLYNDFIEKNILIELFRMNIFFDNMYLQIINNKCFEIEDITNKLQPTNFDLSLQECETSISNMFSIMDIISTFFKNYKKLIKEDTFDITIPL